MKKEENDPGIYSPQQLGMGVGVVIILSLILFFWIPDLVSYLNNQGVSGIKYESNQSVNELTLTHEWSEKVDVVEEEHRNLGIWVEPKGTHYTVEYNGGVKNGGYVWDTPRKDGETTCCGKNQYTRYFRARLTSEEGRGEAKLKYKIR